MASTGRGRKSMGIIGLLGAAATAWYFLDPKKGAARRERVSERAQQAYSSAETEIRRIGNTTAKGLSSAVDRTSDIARQGLEKISGMSHDVAESVKNISDRTRTRLEEDGEDMIEKAKKSIDKSAKEAKKLVSKAK